jgi:cbb3-type cytochrome oxidase cytochrome c subunit
MDLIEASCYKCHKAQTEIKNANKLNAGITLIKRFGCYGCHKINDYTGLRKVGPDLRKIANKVNQTWAFNWIKNPKKLQPDSKMPRFFGLLNDITSVDSLRNDVQVRAIVEYLYFTSNTEEYQEPPVVGNPQQGRTLVETIGCLGCHKIGELSLPDMEIINYMDFGSNLGGIGSKTSVKWLYHWLKNPKKYFPETVMPRMRLTDQEAADISAYLFTLKNYQIDNVPMPTMSLKMLNELTLDYLKRTMLSSSASEKLGLLSEKEKYRYLGERLIARYGCFGCHEISGFDGNQPIGTDLSEIGSKLVSRFDFGLVDIPHSREEWLQTKLKTPRKFDRGKIKDFEEKLKMPNFYLSDDEAQAILVALLGLTREKVNYSRTRILTSQEQAVQQGLQLVQERNCRGCHIIDGLGGYQNSLNVKASSGNRVNEIETSVNTPPNLTNEGKKVQPDWLFRFMKDPLPIRPWLKIRMPTFYLSDEDALIIEQYFTHSSKQKFPYNYKDKPRLTEEQTATAQLLLSEEYFSCFSCHQQGEKNPEGPPGDWAPDLSLAKQRLRPDWVQQWITNPQVLEPGTKMPTYFDPDYFDESGPDDILDGNEELQIKVITDYIMSLGEN